MDRTNGISVVINTYNAEKHLREMIAAVKDFDEVLVCDMESTDNTVAIARDMGCRIVTFPKEGVSIVEPARQFAIEQASCPWVLVVDADELITPQLKDYLYQRIKEEDCPEGIAIPRKNYFMGRFMHSCYPDYILRFFKKEVTHWPPFVHCSPLVEGKVERIPKSRKDLAFEHLANDSVADILRKNNIYSDYEMLRRRDKSYGIAALLGKPLFRFFKSYFLKGGCLDGMPGLIYAGLVGMYQFNIVAKLMEERLAQTDTMQ